MAASDDTAEEEGLEQSLQAGIAIYNAGRYHAAHDAWEDHWLELEQGTEDERFLHGLIQFTAAVYHAGNRNWSGTVGLATSARRYLEGLPETYHSVDLEMVRRTLERIGNDPEIVERRSPPRLTYNGVPLVFGDLDLVPTGIAATVLAEEDGYDESLFEDALEFAREDVARGAQGPFVPLLFDFVRQPANRDIIAQRLCDHVERRRTRDDDVAGLFDTSD